MITAENPDCLIVTGMPGAGKSTVTRLIAERLPRSARLDGDFVSRLVVSGRVGALGEPAAEAARQVELCNRDLCTLANDFSDAGFTVYRPVRDAEPVAVRLAWWRDDPHPAAQPAIELLTSLYREPKSAGTPPIT